jgi:serine/threonine protein kinase
MHRIGDIIDDRYHLTRPLGIRHGTEVWEAEHQIVGRTVTLKILPAEVAADPVARKRLVAEASTAAEIGHPTVLEVYDVGVDRAGVPYLVTEPIRGEMLTDILARQGAMQPEDACELAMHLLAGLEAAHAANITHGDLTSDCIIVKSGRNGQLVVKILDFGVARPLDPSDSPEDASRSRAIDPIEDLQAVGALLYEMLTGRSGVLEPLRASEASEAAMAGEVTETRSLVPAIPAGLARIVDQALSIHAARRIGSAKEMANLLAPFAVSDRPRSLAPRNTVAPFLSPEARRMRGMARLERAVLGLQQEEDGQDGEKTSVRPNLVLVDRSERHQRVPAKSPSNPARLAPHELVEPRIPRPPRTPKHYASHLPRPSAAERAMKTRSRKYPSLKLRRWKAAQASQAPDQQHQAESESAEPGKAKALLIRRSFLGLRFWPASLLAMAGLSAGLLLARLLHF